MGIVAGDFFEVIVQYQSFVDESESFIVIGEVLVPAFRRNRFEGARHARIYYSTLRDLSTKK